VVARARRRRAGFGTIGPILALADSVAVLLVAVVLGASGPAVIGASAVAVLVARAADLHRPRLELSVDDDLPGLVVVAASATVVLVATGSSPLVAGVLVLLCVSFAHTLVLMTTRVLRRLGRLRRRVLVVGTGGVARRLALTLRARPELGLRPVGFVGTGAATPLGQARGLPLPLLGPVAGLPRAMTEARVDAVVVALSGPADPEVTAAVEGLLAAPAEVYAAATWLPPGTTHHPHDRELVGDVPVVHLRPRESWRPVRALERVDEVVASAVALAVLLPLFGLLALLVRVETGGVLVRHPRLRFRTRRARSVARPGTTFSVAISGRIGPVGRLLRATHLVALPELVWAQARRLRYAGGIAGPEPALAAAPGADEPQVDAGQLAG
jgi:hypothetical protein